MDGIRQSASQCWCLLRFLPLLIGSRVPEGHEGWHIYLILRKIMDLSFAPVITEDMTYMLQGLVDDHHTTFLEVGLIYS